MADELSRIADDLYGIPPAEFVAARTGRARALDERKLAARVTQLRRPAPAAWIVNLLVRSHRGELEELLELGSESRTAQASLDRAEMTRLAKQRRELVSTLARAGARLAAEAGHPAQPAVVDAVATTLDAGLVDPDAAEAIRTGRLLRPLQAIGFDPVDLAEAVAVPEAGSRAAQKRQPRERANLRVVDDADAELTRARTRADAAVTRAERDVEAATAELDEAETRVRDARTALAAAQREETAAQRARDDATASHNAARAALDAARAQRRELS